MKKRGFTLTEVMVAVFMISLGIMAVLIIFPLGIKIIRSSDLSTEANSLAQGKIEEIISQSYDSIAIGTSNEALASPFSAFSRQTVVSYVNPQDSMAQAGSDLGIKKIEVTVSWNSSLGLGTQNIIITTLFGKR